MNKLLLQSLAFPATVALIVFLRRHAPLLGLVDVPGGRKQHHGGVPLAGRSALLGCAGLFLKRISLRCHGLRALNTRFSKQAGRA